MSELIIHEFVTIVKSIWLGVVFGFSYDIIRIFRRILRHRHIVSIIIEDILFGIYVGIRGFILIYTENSGEIRGFIILFMFLGALMYNRSLGRFFVLNITRLIKIILKPLNLIISHLNIILNKSRKEKCRGEKRKQKSKS